VSDLAARIGIDLGGTKTEIIVLSPYGETLLRNRVPTVRNDYASTISTIVQLVTRAEAELNLQGSVGVATPGAASPATGVLKNANSTWLNGKHLKMDLEQALKRPVCLANDANCFVLSEATDGAAKDAQVVFGVIVGTGTGGGIVVNKQLLTGANAIAGEWGHNSLPWPQAEELPGPPCYCGKKGCIETFLSGPGMSADHYNITGQQLDAEQIATLAESGDAAAEQTLARYERRMAKALANVINILDPDVVVLGGGVSNIARLYRNVAEQWQSYVFSDQLSTSLVRAQHGDSSGVRGAAWLCGDNVFGQ